MDKRLDRSVGLFVVSLILVLVNYYFLRSIFLIYVLCGLLFIIAAAPVVYFTFNKRKSYQLKELSKIDTSTDFQFIFYLSELMKLAGFKDITFARQYGDSFFDILAQKDGEVVGVNGLLSKEKIQTTMLESTKEERDRLALSKVIVTTNATFSPSAVRYAQKHAIELWDRKVLGKLLDQSYQQQKVEQKGDSRGD